VFCPWRRGIVVIAATFRRISLGIEYRQDVWFLGLCTLLCCFRNLICIVNWVYVFEKNNFFVLCIFGHICNSCFAFSTYVSAIRALHFRTYLQFVLCIFGHICNSCFAFSDISASPCACQRWAFPSVCFWQRGYGSSLSLRREKQVGRRNGDANISFFRERRMSHFCWAVVIPPPKKKKLETIASKQACFIKANKYFLIKKNDTGYHQACALLCALAYMYHIDLMCVHACAARKRACFIRLPHMYVACARSDCKQYIIQIAFFKSNIFI
jgi:hypothetical protein